MKKYILTALLFVLLTVPAFADKKVHVKNITLTSANTEYDWTVPSGMTNFTLQARTSADLKISDTEGASGTTYFTLKSGAALWDIDLSQWGNTIYMQCETAGTVVEIVYWSKS